MGQPQSPYPKTVETIAMSLVPNPYIVLPVTGPYYTIVFCWDSFLLNETGYIAIIESGLRKSAILLSFLNTGALEKA